MSKDFWERVDKLDELAERATQGEWVYVGLWSFYKKDNETSEALGTAEHYYDGEYIAAANPAMIKEMINMLRLQKKHLDFCDAALAKYND